MRMMMKTLIALSLPLVMLAACGEKTDGGNVAAAPQTSAVPAPAGTEWVSTVAVTPDGGMRMGNPDASVKLVEYASMSCSHCADFSEASEVKLGAMVASGRVSYELRNYVRDPMDLSATLLARCAGPGPFFPIVKAMFAEQPNWFTKLQALSASDQQAFTALAPTQQFERYAQVIGTDMLVRQRGVSADKAKACLADQGEVDKLVKMRDRANTEFNLQGTPTFLINGQVVPETGNWDGLEPKLRAAGA
jgi:protein-disulfide isomerase